MIIFAGLAGHVRIAKQKHRNEAFQAKGIPKKLNLNNAKTFKNANKTEIQLWKTQTSQKCNKSQKVKWHTGKKTKLAENKYATNGSQPSEF